MCASALNAPLSVPQSQLVEALRYKSEVRGFDFQ